MNSLAQSVRSSPYARQPEHVEAGSNLFNASLAAIIDNWTMLLVKIPTRGRHTVREHQQISQKPKRWGGAQDTT